MAYRVPSEKVKYKESKSDSHYEMEKDHDDINDSWSDDDTFKEDSDDDV